jgi:SAM-dependent methyltransferase
MLTPTRRRGFEYLDDPALGPAVAARSLADVALANRWFGGTRAVLRELAPIVRVLHARGRRTLLLLDIGTGLADIPAAAARLGRELGVAIHTVGLEKSPALAAVGRHRVDASVAGDARVLPFADRSIDLITCSQVLHHFEEHDANLLLMECTRVATHGVIVSDLRRSWLAIGLLWLTSFPLRFHWMSRHDGMTSIRRGFTVGELRALVARAARVTPAVRRHLGWRVTATWVPGTSTT